MGFPGGSDGKESACDVGDPSSILGLERSPGEGNGCPLWYSSWGIQWTEGPGEPQPTGSQRVGHDRVTEAELRKIKLCSDHFSMLLNNHSEQHFCPVLDHPVILCYVGPLYKPPRVVQGASSPLNV